MGVAIIGTGAYLPARRVTNRDLIEMGVDTTDEWIVSRTGIRTRYWAAPEQATSDLATEAVRLALRHAGASPRDVRLVICATSSPDYALPSTASVIHRNLRSAGGGFDVNGVCSGFAYALGAGFALCEQAGDGVVVVVGADTYSRWIDVRNREAAVFFGDGAGAVVLASTDAPSWFLSTVSGTHGDGVENIIVPMGGSRAPCTSDGIAAGENKLIMRGKPVWQFATAHVPTALRQVLDAAGLGLEDVDLVIPHQANARMLGQIVDSAGVPARKLVVNVDRYGNTAAASIPIALHEAVTAGRLAQGNCAVLVGFGGGLTWSALCLRWGQLPADARGAG